MDVIVLNWNGWRDTLECLRSLEALDYADHRVLVVDNGSTDGSVERLRAARPGLSIVETGRNLGFAGGVNAGLRRSLEGPAELVWLLNNDAFPEPQALDALVRHATADERVGLVGSALVYAHDRSTVQALGGGYVHWWLGLPHHVRRPDGLARLEYIVGASLLVKRAVLEEVGLLDERFFMYWEDADFSRRARLAGWRLAVAPDSVVYHREGGTASGGARRPSLAAERFHLRSLVRFMRKHHRFWPVPVLVRAALEVGNQLRHGTPGRIPPLLGEIASALRDARR